MCDDTPPLRSHRLPPLTAPLAQNSAELYFTAKLATFATISQEYPGKAQELLIFVVSLYILEKASSIAYVGAVITARRNRSFDVDLFKKSVLNI